MTLIEHHQQVVQQNAKLKRKIMQLIVQINNFEVTDLDPVVTKMTSWLDKLT